MPAHVCVLTGKGFGAIGSIMLHGQGAVSILSEVFTPAVSFQTGGIFHGQIIEGGQIIDDVIVGCELEDRFVIHCHGNPILVQKIIELFVRRGAQLTDFENTVFGNSTALLEKEACIEQLKAVTIGGVKIIQSQVTGGLSATVKRWMDKDVSIEEIQKQGREILERSRIARRIIQGVKIVLAGPANSGKSTLLNTLAGSQKAIVSEIAGTTRDWVSVLIHIGPLRVEVIDTAGFGENALREAVDKSAQQKTLELMRQCDCVLWIEDGNAHCENVRGGSDRGAAEVDGHCPVPAINLPLVGGCHPLMIQVLNKSDLTDGKMLSEKLDPVRISAKTGDGIDTLLCKIQKQLQVNDFDCTLPAAFTSRQVKILQAITESKNQQQIQQFLTSLINSY